MTNTSEGHHRRSIRLKDYDYSQAGAYFVTICTHERQPLFGQIVGAGLAPAQNYAVMQVNAIGKIAHDQWMQIPNRFYGVSLDVFVVMPNHIHGIIVIDDGDGQPRGGQPGIGQTDIGQPRGLPLQQPNGLPRWERNGLPVRQPRDGQMDVGQPQGLPLSDRDGLPVRQTRGGQMGIGQPHDGQPLNGQPHNGQPRGLPLQQPNGLPLHDWDGLPLRERNGLPLRERNELGDIIGAYKSLVANECLALYKSNNQPMGKLWQRNYYEHIIRDETSYLQIAQYILDNPVKWELDSLYLGETL